MLNMQSFISKKDIENCQVILGNDDPKYIISLFHNEENENETVLSLFYKNNNITQLISMRHFHTDNIYEINDELNDYNKRYKVDVIVSNIRHSLRKSLGSKVANLLDEFDNLYKSKLYECNSIFADKPLLHLLTDIKNRYLQLPNYIETRRMNFKSNSYQLYKFENEFILLNVNLLIKEVANINIKCHIDGRMTFSKLSNKYNTSRFDSLLGYYEYINSDKNIN